MFSPTLCNLILTDLDRHLDRRRRRLMRYADDFLVLGRSACACLSAVATVSAVRYNPQIKAFYDRLIVKGKPKQVALVACAHKLRTILNAMLRDRIPWRSETATSA